MQRLHPANGAASVRKARSPHPAAARSAIPRHRARARRRARFASSTPTSPATSTAMSRARRLQRNIEAAMSAAAPASMRKAVFGTHFAAERETLQQAESRSRAVAPPVRSTRRTVPAAVRSPRSPMSQNDSNIAGLRPARSRITPDDQRTQRPGEEPGAERGERGQQTRARCFRGKKRPADLRRRRTHKSRSRRTRSRCR